jgi:hypothetical protein
MAKTRQLGIEAVGDVPWGTHLCAFYHTREDLVELLAREGWQRALTTALHRTVYLPKSQDD